MITYWQHVRRGKNKGFKRLKLRSLREQGFYIAWRNMQVSEVECLPEVLETFFLKHMKRKQKWLEKDHHLSSFISNPGTWLMHWNWFMLFTWINDNKNQYLKHRYTDTTCMIAYLYRICLLVGKVFWQVANINHFVIKSWCSVLKLQWSVALD